MFEEVGEHGALWGNVEWGMDVGQLLFHGNEYAGGDVADDVDEHAAVFVRGGG
jgi:hypothetical protein